VLVPSSLFPSVESKSVSTAYAEKQSEEEERTVHEANLPKGLSSPVAVGVHHLGELGSPVSHYLRQYSFYRHLQRVREGRKARLAS
jgi:hypothetical protein